LKHQRLLKLQPVPFKDVTIQDAFWAPRRATNRIASIPFSFQKLEEAGSLDDLRWRRAARRPVFGDRSSWTRTSTRRLTFLNIKPQRRDARGENKPTEASPFSSPNSPPSTQRSQRASADRNLCTAIVEVVRSLRRNWRATDVAKRLESPACCRSHRCRPVQKRQQAARTPNARARFGYGFAALRSSRLCGSFLRVLAEKIRFSSRAQKSQGFRDRSRGASQCPTAPPMKMRLNEASWVAQCGRHTPISSPTIMPTKIGIVGDIVFLGATGRRVSGGSVRVPAVCVVAAMVGVSFRRSLGFASRKSSLGADKNGFDELGWPFWTLGP
jgi:hypothetical protein